MLWIVFSPPKVCRFSSILCYYFVRSLATEHDRNEKRNFSEYSEQSTHFGFETVTEKEKAEKVKSMFSNVASKYDLMNDIMSGGTHRLWKDYFVRCLHPTPGTKLLDVAGGTGDITFRFLQHLKSENENAEVSDYITNPYFEETDTDTRTENNIFDSHVVVCDINAEMLDVGKQKAQKYGFASGISWVQGDAENLPFADNSFDAYTIAFGIRNVVHIEKVLSEAFRVLRKGGRFLCLEFSHVTNPLLHWIYDAYSFQVIPVMGQVVARDWKAYQYLAESIRKFPKQEEFCSKIENAGFRIVSYENLMFGITAIHSGFKL